MTTYEEVVECVITGSTHIWKFSRAAVKEMEVGAMTVGAAVGTCACGARIAITKPLSWAAKVKPIMGIDQEFLDRINALPSGLPDLGRKGPSRSQVN